jgi:hypothetical protein
VSPEPVRTPRADRPTGEHAGRAGDRVAAPVRAPRNPQTDVTLTDKAVIDAMTSPYLALDR